MVLRIGCCQGGIRGEVGVGRRKNETGGMRLAKGDAVDARVNLCTRYVCTNWEGVMADLEPEEPKAPRQVGVREFRGNMTGILRQARQGETFLITSHGEVIAEVRPPSVLDRKRRQPGALRGKIQVSADFDELPVDVLAAMEGEDA